MSIARVQSPVEHVEGLELGDQLLRAALVRAPWVGEVGHGLPVAVEPLQVLLVAHDHEQDLAAFLGLADDLDPDAARGRGERAVVRVDLRGARELTGSAHDVPQVLRGRGDVRMMGHVAHPGGQEVGLGGGSGDSLGRAELGGIRSLHPGR
jgi:hypothetical protein